MTIDEMIEQLGTGDHETYPPATDIDIQATETVLGKSLPASYKNFVKSFSNGAYLYMLQEVGAVGEGNKQISSLQDLAITEAQPDDRIPFRDGGEMLFKNLIPFSLDSNDNAWCFISNDSQPSIEQSVAYLDTTGQKLYGRLNSFTDWLQILIKKQNEVIRTLYDEDVLHEELELG